MIPENLRRFRNIKGMSQQQVADYLGVSRQAYTRYEMGQREPGIDVLTKLAKLYNYQVDVFFSKHTTDDILATRVLLTNLVHLSIEALSIMSVIDDNVEENDSEALNINVNRLKSIYNEILATEHQLESFDDVESIKSRAKDYIDY